MPYIDKVYRVAANEEPMTAGELNYKITQVLIEYQISKSLNYQTLNDILGALEGAKAEFYRRVVVPYEEAAKERNGDVYL